MPNAALERATLAKVTRRLLPFLFLLYLVCFLDRVNVGFAALQMNRDLGFSPAAYGFGAGIFFFGYVLFEVPSNLILARLGARVWIARIMITWGLHIEVPNGSRRVLVEQVSRVGTILFWEYMTAVNCPLR